MFGKGSGTGSAPASSTSSGSVRTPTYPPTTCRGSGSSTLLGDEPRHRPQGFVELRRVVSARLRKVRPAAAAAADQLRDLADQRSGAHLLRGGGRYARNEGHLVVGHLRTEHDDRLAELALVLVRRLAQRPGIRALDPRREHADAVHLHGLRREVRAAPA